MDLSVYESLNNRPGPRGCKLPDVVDELRDAAGARPREAEEFLLALHTPKIQTRAIERRLAALGIHVSHSFISRHRNGGCRHCEDFVREQLEAAQ